MNDNNWDSSSSCQFNTIEDVIEATHSKKWQTRKMALKKMCPCRVQKEIDILWTRIFEMVNDEHAEVRYQVVHTLCDGSPKHMELKIVDTLQSMWNDKEDKIRKKVRFALNAYRRTGDWNVL